MRRGGSRVISGIALPARIAARCSGLRITRLRDVRCPAIHSNHRTPTRTRVVLRLRGKHIGARRVESGASPTEGRRAKRLTTKSTKDTKKGSDDRSGRHHRSRSSVTSWSSCPSWCPSVGARPHVGPGMGPFRVTADHVQQRMGRRCEYGLRPKGPPIFRIPTGAEMDINGLPIPSDLVALIEAGRWTLSRSQSGAFVDLGSEKARRLSEEDDQHVLMPPPFHTIADEVAGETRSCNGCHESRATTPTPGSARQPASGGGSTTGRRH